MHKGIINSTYVPRMWRKYISLPAVKHSNSKQYMLCSCFVTGYVQYHTIKQIYSIMHVLKLNDCTMSQHKTRITINAVFIRLCRC